MKRGVFVAAVAAAVVAPSIPVPAARVMMQPDLTGAAALVMAGGEVSYAGETVEIVEYWWKTYHCVINPETGEVISEATQHHAICSDGWLDVIA